MNWGEVHIGDELGQYNMTGLVINIDRDLKKVVLHFDETGEDIQFDFDEF